MRYLFLLFFLTTYNTFAQSSDCSKFKTGDFKYTNPDFEHFMIVRNDSIQIETDTKSGVIMTGSIKWLSDCKYTLTYTEVNDSNRESIIGLQFYVDIISTKDNTYKYKAYNDTHKMTGEILKIK